MSEFVTNIKNDYTKKNTTKGTSLFVPLYKIKDYKIIISNETRDPNAQHKSRLIKETKE